jgi:signal peptidase I
MAPTIGFIAINMATTQKDLRKAGIPTPKRPTPNLRKSQRSVKGWLAVSVFLVLIVWTATGLFGFYPTIVGSGSMRPTMDVGDIAIVISTDPNKIQIGDIIQYWQDGEMTLHRVIDIISQGGTRLFQTKGDDNPTPDPELVLPTQIRGKLILTIPKLGWVSIYIKEFAANAYTFLTATLPKAITEGGTFILANTIPITAALTLTAYTYLLFTYHKTTRKEGKNE